MRPEAAQQPTGRRRPAKWVLLRAGKFYALAALLHAILSEISQIPAVRGFFLRVVWRLGRWPDLPFPYDFSDYLSSPLFPEAEVAAVYVSVLIFGLVCLTLAVATVHSLTFGLVVVAHSLLGWPRYWSDVRSRISLQTIWVGSAKCSWWVWPLAQFVWLLIYQVSSGCRYASYPIIDTRPPFLAAYLLAVVLLYAYRTTPLLRTEVVQAVGPDELRCTSCGYMLRGLEDPRCPECGYEGNRDGKAEYGFRWGRARGLRGTSTVLRFAILPALFLAPVWVPLILVGLPRPWLRFVPLAIRPDWQVLSPNRNAFPISLDAVCVVRHGDQLAVIRFGRVAALSGRYDAGYWSNASKYGSEPADGRTSGKVTNRGGPNLLVGPWRFSCSTAGANMLWLTRPDATFIVEAFEPEQFSGDLSWVDPLP